MNESHVKHLICPQTGADLRLEDATLDGERILQGRLVNVDDDNIVYAIRDGIPRFVDTHGMEAQQRDTVETFAFKWSQIPNYAFDEASKDYREGWYYERFNFPQGDADVKSFLSGAEFILEAGTGTGVDTDMLVRNSTGVVFGIDISSAIDIAYERFIDNERVVLLQADIGHLPFRAGFFEVISCDQVLHHTPNPPQNFGKLANLLTEAGKMLLYVYKVKGALREFSDDYLRGLYTDSDRDAAIDFSRRITNLGRNLSQLDVTVEVDDDIPEFGIPKGTHNVQRLIYDYIFKCYWNDSFDYDTNVMVNFDWYRPKHAYRYTPKQVEGWCADNGMTIAHMDVSPSGISAVMQKGKA